MAEEDVEEQDEELRKQAIARLENRRGFWPHLICYLAVNALLVGIWATTGGGYFWPMWVIGLWGVGLIMHAWTAFAQKPISEEDVQREMRRGGTAAA